MINLTEARSITPYKWYVQKSGEAASKEDVQGLAQGYSTAKDHEGKGVQIGGEARPARWTWR